MHDQTKSYEELLKENAELKDKLQKSIDSSNNVVSLLDRQYRQLVDSANEAIVVIQDGFLCLTNPITSTITGYSEKEIGTIPFQLFIHPEDRDRVVENHSKRLKGENIPSYYVFRLLNKNGSIRWVYMNAVLIDWDGSPATLNFLSDITNLKLAEEALEQSSKKWDAVISASPDGIGMISLDGKIQLISDKLINMHGYAGDQKSEIIGRSIFDFIDPSDHKLLLENTQKLMAGEKNTELTEYKAIKKDNSRFYIDVNASILHDSNGKLSSILYVERDITERKMAEAVIKKSNQELEKLNSEKNKLSSIIAHDLRSSFNNLIGFTEALATDSHNMTSAVITKYSSSLHRSVLALYTLLENLLEWALLQRGSILFVPKYLLLSDIFSQSKGSIEEKALLKEITILNEISVDQEIYGDEKMITSVLRNLLSNAVKFTKRGGEVVAKAKKIEGGFVEISLTDNGVGIPGSIIDKLFKLNESVGSKGTDNEPSTGLGLVLCREFVEKNGGKIWVESQKNMGSTFYFTIPSIDKISKVA